MERIVDMESEDLDSHPDIEKALRDASEGMKLTRESYS